MWKCIGCGEEVEDDFEICWNCRTSKDGLSSEIIAGELTNELENLRENVSKAPNDDLLRIVNVDSKQYSEETLVLARTELSRRNLFEASQDDWDKLKGLVEASRAELDAEKNKPLFQL